jgi:hypothetical protein
MATLMLLKKSIRKLKIFFASKVVAPAKAGVQSYSINADLKRNWRKCLDFKSPAEIFSKQLLHFKCELTSLPTLARRSKEELVVASPKGGAIQKTLLIF